MTRALLTLILAVGMAGCFIEWPDDDDTYGTDKSEVVAPIDCPAPGDPDQPIAFCTDGHSPELDHILFWAIETLMDSTVEWTPDERRAALAVAIMNAIAQHFSQQDLAHVQLPAVCDIIVVVRKESGCLLSGNVMRCGE